MSLNEWDGHGLKPTRHVQHRVHVDFEDHAPIFSGQIDTAERQTQRLRRRDGQPGEFGREVVDRNDGGHRTLGFVARRIRIGLHMFAHSEHPIMENDDAELVAASVVVHIAGVAGYEPVLA